MKPLFRSRARIRFALPLLALLGITGCTETVVYRQPAPPPPTTVVVQRPPTPAPPLRVRSYSSTAAVPCCLGPRSLALERFPLGLDPRPLSPGIDSVPAQDSSQVRDPCLGGAKPTPNPIGFVASDDGWTAPNVYYEPGIALESASRPAILIVGSGDEVPFEKDSIPPVSSIWELRR